MRHWDDGVPRPGWTVERIIVCTILRLHDWLPVRWQHTLIYYRCSNCGKKASVDKVRASR